MLGETIDQHLRPVWGAVDDRVKAQLVLEWYEENIGSPPIDELTLRTQADIVWACPSDYLEILTK